MAQAARPAEAAATAPAIASAAEARDPAVVWVRHLLIRHADADQSVPFGPTELHFSGASSRSRAAAQRRAAELAERAQAHPERFSELALEQSDDEFTRELGGALGGMAPAQFRPWPSVRQALLQLQPGHVSGVVETSAGFHVFLREPPPLPAVLSGSRIVIGYDTAAWLHRHVSRPGRSLAKRSRAEALELATRIYRRVVEHPDLFAQAVEEHSDHRDALRGGDFGQWSTDEASAHPRETAILQRLEIGQVHPPVDSMVGFEIIRRTPNTERRTYAMSAIQLRFDPNADPGTPFSKTIVADEATRLAREVASDPDRFAPLRDQNCCARPKVWQSGRGAPALEVALERLALNQVATEAVEVDHWFVIPQRLNPDSAVTR